MQPIEIQNILAELTRSIGETPIEILPIAASGSARKYYRIFTERRSMIGTYSENTEENEAFLTIKSGNEVSHFEWEKEIEVADAKDLLQICLAGVIHKMRWIVPAEEKNLCWEVDEFLNHPENLILAEIELPSETAVFTKPNFVGEEVTGEAQYYNANMLIN